MNVQQILRPLLDLEEKLGELYAWLADVHAEDADLASMLRQLARDEKSHAQQVEYQRRLSRQNPRLFGDVELDLAEVYAGLERIQKVRANLQPPEAEDAIRLVLELECNAAECHYRNVLAKLDPGVARLLGALGRGDRQHYDMLFELAQRRGLVGPDTPLPPPPPPQPAS